MLYTKTMQLKPWRLVGITIASAYFLYCAATPSQEHFIDLVNLIFHEAGHAIFIFFGNFIHVLMGSGFQVLLPACISAYFFKTAQPLSGAVSLMWAGENMTNVSVYAGDAALMQLPLLGGDSSMHDWHYLLSTTGLLWATPLIAGAMYLLGLAFVLVGVAYAYWYELGATKVELF